MLLSLELVRYCRNGFLVNQVHVLARYWCYALGLSSFLHCDQINMLLKESVCECPCMYAHVYACTWGLEDNLGYHDEEYCPYPLRWSLSLVWNSPIKPDWLSSYLHSPVNRVTGICHYAYLLWRYWVSNSGPHPCKASTVPSYSAIICY